MLVSMQGKCNSEDIHSACMSNNFYNLTFQQQLLLNGISDYENVNNSAAGRTTIFFRENSVSHLTVVLLKAFCGLLIFQQIVNGLIWHFWRITFTHPNIKLKCHYKLVMKPAKIEIPLSHKFNYVFCE